MRSTAGTTVRRCIGFDIDNTVISYDGVFAPVAVDLGLLAAPMRRASKAEVKQALIHGRDEHDWMRLQGQVYGRYLHRAKAYPGALEVLRSLAAMLGLRVCLVSHKTRYGHFDDTRKDLRRAALDWLEEHRVLTSYGGGIDSCDVIFTDSRDEKVQAIAALGCAVFVDDLATVLTHPEFPAGAKRILFAPRGAPPPADAILVCRSWPEVDRALRQALAAPADGRGA